MVNSVKRLALVFAVVIGCAGPGFADAISDRVVALLRAQGFEVIQMDRTWLGRIWILAESKDVRREIVFNPATGEILRDYAVLRTAPPPRDRSDQPSDPQVATGGGTQTGVQSVGASGVVAAADPDALPPPAAKDWLSPSAGSGANAAADEFMLDPVNPIAPQWGDDVTN